MIDNNDRDFFKDYKPLRNELRQYKAEPTIKFLIQKLHEIYFLLIKERERINEWNDNYPPQSYILLLIKFVLIENFNLNNGYYCFTKKYKIIDDKNLENIYRKFDQSRQNQKPEPIYNKNETLENRIKKFIRQTSFQQFWLDPVHGLNLEKIDRALYLFLNNNDFNNFFQETAGISIECFFKITVDISNYFLKLGQINTFFKIDLNNIGNFSTNEINKYLDLLCFTIDDAGRFAKDDWNYKDKNLKFQFVEQTPFILKPFLKIKNEYFLYSPALLCNLFHYYIYDFLKKAKNEKFCSLFGNEFEKYVKKGLDYTGIAYKSEDDLRKAYGKKNTVIDFLIENDQGIVLLEVKAVEMDNFSRVNQDNDVLIKRLKQSIIKAITQAYSIADKLKSSKKQNHKKIYVVIVTYKELYLGTISSCWDEFLHDGIQKYCTENNIDISLIQAKDIHVITIDDFDQLVKAMRQDKNCLIPFLEHLTHISGNLEGRILCNHIKEYFNLEEKSLPYLENNLENLFK